MSEDTKEPIELLGNRNALDWAKSFIKVIKEFKSDEAIDIHFMLVWFANAIENGVTIGKSGRVKVEE